MLNPYDVERLAALRQAEARRAAAYRHLVAQVPRTTPAWSWRPRAGLAALLVTLAGRVGPTGQPAGPSVCAC